MVGVSQKSAVVIFKFHAREDERVSPERERSAIATLIRKFYLNFMLNEIGAPGKRQQHLALTDIQKRCKPKTFYVINHKCEGETSIHGF